jgi:hypothetical protein
MNKHDNMLVMGFMEYVSDAFQDHGVPKEICDQAAFEAFQAFKEECENANRDTEEQREPAAGDCENVYFI